MKGGDRNMENNQGLGKSCHSKKTAEDQKKYGRREA
jgi:5-methylcytosine-specific restriction endonuclease McrA